MVEDLGAADGGGRRGFQAELRPRKAEESVPALLADTKEIPGSVGIPGIPETFTYHIWQEYVVVITYNSRIWAISSSSLSFLNLSS